MILNFKEFSDLNQINEGLILESIQQKYPCVDKDMSLAIEHSINKGIPKDFVKYGLGILGRESDFGEVMGKYGIKAVPEYVINSAIEYIPGLESIIKKTAKKVFNKENWVPSMGIAQMTPDVAKKYNVNLNDLMTLSGSLYAACKYLMDLYNKVKVYYDEKSPSYVIFENKLIKNPSSSGNSAMDAAIASYNLGPSYFTKYYCETENPGYLAPYNNPGDFYKPFPKDNPNFSVRVFKNKIVKNYIPTIKTSTKGIGKKIMDKVGMETKDEYISSTGYLKEVVKIANGIKCI